MTAAGHDAARQRPASEHASGATERLAVNDDASSTVRVAFFSDAFPERNGTGAYYHDLIPQLEQRVQALRVFQPRHKKQGLELSIPMPGDAGQRLVAPHALDVHRACKELQPTVVVVVTPGLFGLLGAWQARRHGATLIAAFHTDFEQLARLYWNPLSRFFISLALRIANRIICKASRVVLINNEGLENDVRRLGATEVEVIGTPLPPAFLHRPRRPIATQLQRVCFAGRLAPEKNVERIIEVAKQFPRIEFAIGGEGPLRESLETMAKGQANVQFLGWLSRDQLIDLLDSASLLLLPSAFETFGSVALEAMARGRPSLVTRTAGIHAWPSLREGLFVLESPEQLYAALQELLTLQADCWTQKSAAASSAAEELNRRTLDQWTHILTTYQRPALPPVQ